MDSSATSSDFDVVNATLEALPPTFAISFASFASDTAPELSSASVAAVTLPPFCVTAPFFSVRPVADAVSLISPALCTTSPSIVVAVTVPPVVSFAASTVGAVSDAPDATSISLPAVFASTFVVASVVPESILAFDFRV